MDLHGCRLTFVLTFCHAPLAGDLPAVAEAMARQAPDGTTTIYRSGEGVEIDLFSMLELRCGSSFFQGG